MFNSAKAIALDIPVSKEELCNNVIETCKANDIEDGYIRLVITRGKGTLGLNPYLCSKPEIIIITAKIQLYPEELYRDGLKIVTVGTVRNHPEAINPKIKSLNYLNNVLAKIEAINSGCLECIMLNHKGEVCEASVDNIFLVSNNIIKTPSVNSGALVGLTRNKVIEISRNNEFKVSEESISRYDLYTADEVFLTGTAAEIISVVEIDKRKIGNGKPGKITKQLSELYSDYTSNSGIPYQ